MRGRIVAIWAALATAVPAASAIIPAPAAAAQAVPVTRDLLIGRWTDNNDCSDAVDFLADGRFLTTDGAAGTWTLVGDRLSFIGERTIAARISATSRDAITLTHDDGSVGASTRCAAARRVAMPALPPTIDAVIAGTRPLQRGIVPGRWTDDGDCGNYIDFHADGRFVIGNGGGGRWALEGERLTFTGNSTVGARARMAGDDHIILIHDDGSIGQSIRC